MKYTKKVQIPFSYGDPAGILFFNRSGDLFHEVLESWWQEAYPWQDIFASSENAFPFLHWEVDFMRPLKAGEEIDFSLEVAKIGESSFHLLGHAHLGEQLCFTTKSVHVCIDPKLKTKKSLDADLRSFLMRYQTAEDAS